MSRCLILDHGLFTSFAERLARDFEVLYFAPFSETSFPSPKPAIVGSGIEGVERVECWERYFLDVDFIVVPNVGMMNRVEMFRSMGIPVWGAGLGEKLELQRWRAKETMRSLGLPVGKCALVTGMTDLRKYIQDNTDVYVKISGFRGIAETFYAPEYDIIKPRLDELECDLGCLGKVFPFIIEHKIESVVEAGIDSWCIDGKYPDSCLTGVEIKDAAYLGSVIDYNDVSEPVRTVNERLSPFFKEAGYRQFFSTEIRVTESGLPYLIDATTRLPLPPSELYHEMISNLGEIIEAGASGEMVQPKWTAKFGALAIITSDTAAEKDCPVKVEPSAEQWVKWRNLAVIEDQSWIVKTGEVKTPEAGAVIGIGDTAEEAILMCLENAKGVSGADIKVKEKAVMEALSEVQKAEDNGIVFSDQEMPSEEDIKKKTELN